MKYLLLFIFCLCSFMTSAQVGINTERPLATLDINGNLRIQEVPLDTLSHNVLLLSADSIVSTNAIENLMISGSNLKSFVKGTTESTNPIVDTTIADGWYKIAFPIIDFNENNPDYNTTTSEFTAPVDGIYDIYIQLKVIGGDIHTYTEVGVGIFQKINGVISLISEETFYEVIITTQSSSIQASPPTRVTQTLAKLKKGDSILFGAKLPSTNIIVDGEQSCFFTIKQIK